MKKNILLSVEKVSIYTDGASRGNPGSSAIGIQFFDSKNHLIYEEGKYIGNQTNNFAEYSAVIYALELTVENRIKEISLYSDSQFLIRQLKGEYKVKSPNIKPLFKKCIELLKNIPTYHLFHIPREENTGADYLANRALDENF